MCFLWLTKLHPQPRVDSKFFKALLVVAAFHTVGHVAACTSFGQMAVSFAHIVKSAEPVFSVALAGPILKETYPIYVWLSLVPIVAGCGLSAMKEVSFAWNGFNNAMLSNIGMVLRNIYSKKALGDYKVCSYDCLLIMQYYEQTQTRQLSATKSMLPLLQIHLSTCLDISPHSIYSSQTHILI